MRVAIPLVSVMRYCCSRHYCSHTGLHSPNRVYCLLAAAPWSESAIDVAWNPLLEGIRWRDAKRALLLIDANRPTVNAYDVKAPIV